MKKKFLCLVFSLGLMLTACESEMEKREASLPLEEVKTTAVELIQTHYDGVIEEDAEKCFGVYAPFYQQAVEDELTYYNYKTLEEYIDGSSEKLKEQFGNDVSVSIDISEYSRLELSEISDYKKLIKDIFELGSPNITDAAEFVINVTYEGNLNSDTEQCTWYTFLINNKWYIYDSYYEDVSAAFESEGKEDTKPGSDVIVIE